MKIGLYDSCNVVALIVEHPTGVFYSQQCGGISCTHPEVEGFCIPINGNDEWEEFCSKTCDAGCYGSDLSGFDAEIPFPRIADAEIKLDRERLDKGTEAFVPVIWSDKKAWLLLPYNCD